MFAETVYFLRKNSINLSTLRKRQERWDFSFQKFTKFTKFTHFRVRVVALRAVPVALRAFQIVPSGSISASGVPVVGGGG